MNRKLFLSTIILVSYMCLIFYISSLPNESLTPEKGMGFKIPQAIKHVAEFGVLGFLMMITLLQLSPTSKFVEISFFFVSWAFSSFYGILDELHQGFVIGRVCSSSDMFVNMIGSVLGSALCLCVYDYRRYRRFKNE